MFDLRILGANRCIFKWLLLIGIFHSSTSSVFGAWGYIDEKTHKTVYPDHGYIDRSGHLVFKCPARTDCNGFANGLTVVTEDCAQTPCYLIDQQGHNVGRRFAEIRSFTEGLAAAGSHGKMGFIDKTGSYVIAPRFTDAMPFKDGLAPVMVNGKFGFIDRSGKYVVDPFFDSVASFSEGLAAAQSQGKIGFIDRFGNWKIKPQYDCVSGFSNGLAFVIADERQTFIDQNGKKVQGLSGVRNFMRTIRVMVDPLPAGLDVEASTPLVSFRACLLENSDFHEGLLPLQLSGKYGYVDKTGAIVINPQFENAFAFKEGLARVRVGKTYGFINKSGTYAVKPRFANAEDFSEGAAAVAIAPNKWGYIDKSGKLFIPPKYSHAQSFSEGLARVQLWGWYQD